MPCRLQPNIPWNRDNALTWAKAQRGCADRYAAELLIEREKSNNISRNRDFWCEQAQRDEVPAELWREKKRKDADYEVNRRVRKK